MYLGIEMLIVWVAWCYNKNMRDQGFAEFQNKTIGEKIKKYGLRLARMTTLILILAFILLVLGFSLLKGRTCYG